MQILNWGEASFKGRVEKVFRETAPTPWNVGQGHNAYEWGDGAKK